MSIVALFTSDDISFLRVGDRSSFAIFNELKIRNLFS